MRKESKFTMFDYIIVIVAIIVEFLLGLTYLSSTEASEREFFIKTMIESGIGLIGLLCLDRIRIGEWQLADKRFKEFNPDNTLLAAAIMFFIVAISQFLTQTFLSVKDWNIALAVIFAAPCEEIMFRGLIISLFIALSVKITKKEKTVISFIGVIISALLFMAFHTNYYGYFNILMSVLIGGLVFGIGYWITDNLGAVIFAHLFVNLFAAGPLIIQILTQVQF